MKKTLMKTAPKETLNKLKKMIDWGSARPLSAQQVTPVNVDLVVEKIGDDACALVWVDGAGQTQKLEVSMINALLLAQRIAGMFEKTVEKQKKVVKPLPLLKRAKKEKKK